MLNSPLSGTDVPVAAERSVINHSADANRAWWLGFNDPLLSALIEEALTVNLDIQSAQASLRAARSQRAIANTSLLPSLTGTLAAGRTAGNNSYKAGLDASWEADFFGKNSFGVKAAESDLQASIASLEDINVSIAAEVASAYVDLRLAQARLSIVLLNFSARRETAYLISLKEQSGLASGLDMTYANLSVGELKAQILVSNVELARSAEESLLSAQASRTQIIISLYKAVGGGW